MSNARADKQTVLFLCTTNSDRSVIAEAILRSLAGDAVEVFSAGSRPGPVVHPAALRLIEEAGCDLPEASPKGVDQLPHSDFDWVITVCDSPRQECPAWLSAGEHLHWPIPDPTAVTGSEEDVREAFSSAWDDLERRTLSWLSQVDVACGQAAISPR